MTPSAETAATDDAWTVAVWVSQFAEYGFGTPEDAPLSDGRPRVIMRRETDSAMTEAIGEEPLEAVSLMLPLTTATASESGELFAAFLNTYAPGTRDEVSSRVKEEEEFTVAFEGGEVSVTTITVSDGAVVVATVTRG